MAQMVAPQIDLVAIMIVERNAQDRPMVIRWAHRQSTRRLGARKMVQATTGAQATRMALAKENKVSQLQMADHLHHCAMCRSLDSQVMYKLRHLAAKRRELRVVLLVHPKN